MKNSLRSDTNDGKKQVLKFKGKLRIKFSVQFQTFNIWLFNFKRVNHVFSWFIDWNSVTSHTFDTSHAKISEVTYPSIKHHQYKPSDQTDHWLWGS